MVLRKARHPRRFNGAAEAAEEESESLQDKGDAGVLTRRMSTGRTATRSDPQVARIADEGGDVTGGRATKEVSRNRSGRYSDLPRLNIQEKTVSLHATAVNSPIGTTEPTPNRSANGSVSGTSATQKGRRINTRSKGSAHSSSSESSSDHEDMPMESLSQLSSSLKLAQSRASTLSTNFSRLMRLVLDDELESLDREIAQVRNGNHQALKATWKRAEVDRDAKKRRANARLVAAEHEIDIRFGAQVDAEWQQFKNDKLELREKMCTELSSQITRLTDENDRARSLAVGVRPSSTLQQAPWWVKNPKQHTWLNLPDGVNDDQRDKDLARMGINPHSRYQQTNIIGLRTPSPEEAHRKRKRKRKHHHDRDDRKRSRREFYPYLDQHESEYMPPPQFEEEVAMSLWTTPWSAMPRTDQSYGNRTSTRMMSSLLDFVQDDMRYHLGAPPPPPPANWLSLPDASMPFKQHPLQAGRRFSHQAPLLPRPSMMSQEQFAETFYPQSPRRPSFPQPPPPPPPLLPLPRLMPSQSVPLEQNGLSLLSIESAGRILEASRSAAADVVASHPGSHPTGSTSPVESRRPPVIAFREPNYNAEGPPRERRESFAPAPSLEPVITPPNESSQPLQSVPPAIEYRQTEPTSQSVPKLIAPRPISAPPPLPSPPVELPRPTPIQPSPAIKSRSGSHSPDAQRNKRPLTLLPKAFRPPSPPPPPPPELTVEDRAKYPLLRFGERSPASPSVPPPPASMGRFGQPVPSLPRYAQPHISNPKVAIPRHPSQIHENYVPLRIAPAPAKKADVSILRDEDRVRGPVEIRRRSSGEQSSPREENSGKKHVGEEDGKKATRNSGRLK